MLKWNLPNYSELDPLPSVGVGEIGAKEEQFQKLIDMAQGLAEFDFPYGLEHANANICGWMDNEFILFKGSFSNLSLAHSRNTPIAKDFLQIYSISGGNLSYKSHDNWPYGGESNTAGLYAFGLDGDELDVSEYDDINVSSIFIPYETIGFDPARHKDFYLNPLSSSIGRVIDAAMTDVIRQMPYVASRDAPALIGEIGELVRDLVLGNRKEANRANITRARKLAMNAYIDEHISDTSLSTARLVKVFGVSRASLYRMFEPDGGVEAHITRRRLHRSLLTLKRTTPKRGAIRKVSEQFGFYDAGNFNRAFKTEFGLKPSDVVGNYQKQRA